MRKLTALFGMLALSTLCCSVHAAEKKPKNSKGKRPSALDRQIRRDSAGQENSGRSKSISKEQAKRSGIALGHTRSRVAADQIRKSDSVRVGRSVPLESREVKRVSRAELGGRTQLRSFRRSTLSNASTHQRRSSSEIKTSRAELRRRSNDVESNKKGPRRQVNRSPELPRRSRGN